MLGYDFGDLVIEDDGDLGFSIYKKNGPDTINTKLWFINSLGEKYLLEILFAKHNKNCLLQTIGRVK